MPSYFSQFIVIQYVPDTVRNERINVGVIVYDEDISMVRFLNNWSRVESFSGNRDVFKHFEAVFNNKSLRDVIDTHESDDWNGAIQLMYPVTTLLPISQAMQSACDRYLVEPTDSAAPSLLGYDDADYTFSYDTESVDS